MQTVKYLQVSRGDVVPGDEWLLLVDNLVNTDVSVEVSLDLLKEDDRAVSASTSV